MENDYSKLSLVVKRKWYDMIASGEKREEYRDATAAAICRAALEGDAA